VQVLPLQDGQPALHSARAVLCFGNEPGPCPEALTVFPTDTENGRRSHRVRPFRNDADKVRSGSEKEIVMKEKRNLHLRVQEMCDCYATTDPLEEMARMKNESGDKEESAVKWLALAVLHGINSDLKEISISLDEEGRVRVKAEHPKEELPAPSTEITDAVMDVVREITHIEEDKGRLPLSIGIRDSSVDLVIKVKSKGERDKVELKFKKEHPHEGRHGHHGEGHHHKH
jgi:hypothetical protein